MSLKLRKNDLIELKKGGLVALAAKLKELQVESLRLAGLKMKNELKNLREPSIIRRATAQLKTIAGQLKESK